MGRVQVSGKSLKENVLKWILKNISEGWQVQPKERKRERERRLKGFGMLSVIELGIVRLGVDGRG